MRRIVIVLLLLAVIPLAAAADPHGLLNAKEPAFLHDIGPQEERADNPVAAVFVAIVVAATIYLGLHRGERKKVIRGLPLEARELARDVAVLVQRVLPGASVNREVHDADGQIE